METGALRRSARLGKKVKTYNEDDDDNNDISMPVIPPKRKRSKLKNTVNIVEELYIPVVKFEQDGEISLQRPSKVARNSNSQQLYDRPAEGTPIPWGNSRTRKQPKIYPVSTRIRMPVQKANNDYWMASAASEKIAKQRSSIRKLMPGQTETRLRSYQDHVPSWYNTFLQRAGTERMFVLNRSRGVEEDCHAHHDDCPCETLQIAGGGGKVYTVTISHLTSCTCPVGIFSRRGDEKQCKHVLYVLYHVLKAPEHLNYQPAFLTSELKELFANAPPLPTEVVEDEPKDGNRKTIEGDCPICFMDFGDEQEIVWCRAACGNNIHKECFDQWARTAFRVTCPLCRSEWQSNEKPKRINILPIQMPTETGPGGYQNVYDQLQSIGNKA